MKFSLSDSDNLYRVRRYTDNSVTILDRTYTHSVIVTADEVIDPWVVNSVDMLNEKTLQPALACDKSIWILGTGCQQQFPPAKLRHFVATQNIGLEVMTTPAASRTFNLLLSEGRSVAALLMIDSINT